MPFDLSALLALKPRQVVLRANAAMKSAEATSLSSDQKALLLRSVALFLDSNGFSKTLKRFLSEADITKEALKGSEALEEIYSKYLEICGDAKTILKAKGEKAVANEVKKPEKQPEEADKDEDKKKKKKNKKNKNSSPEDEPKPTKDVNVEEKPSSDSIADETRAEEKISKSKTKKSKKESSKDTELNGAEDDDDASKGSKKRKRSVPDETQTKPLCDEKIENEESKRRKVTGVASEKKNEDCHENGTVINDSDHQVNDAEKSGGRKSAKKEINGSAEPKTVKAFQRVKVDEVEFTDERLKDNSYWAKSGAEIGYGAKAEEVLSQVKGRGFRHEKTKKKRGSYRGGQIDQGSHSIKFNYSDEE